MRTRLLESTSTMSVFSFEDFQRMHALETYGFTQSQRDGVTEKQIQNEFWNQVASRVILVSGDVIPLKVTQVCGIAGDTYKMFAVVIPNGDSTIQMRLFDSLEQAEGTAMLYGTPTKRVFRTFQLKIKMMPSEYEAAPT